MSEFLTSVGPALGNHLWQSTAFAVAGALLAVLLKKNQARTRYWIWLTASMKFLVPFSLLIAAGSMLPKPQHAPVVTQATYAAMDMMSEPFAAQALPVTPIHIATSNEHRMPEVAASVWLCGLVVVLAMCWMRWRRVAAVVREATEVDAGREVEVLRRLERDAGMRPVRLLLSRSSMEPGMFGVLRPALLWPEGISARLSDVQMEAILAHELCHVRRRDNLFAVSQMVVEATFWFHPLVWWMGARMVEERERACDEEVLRRGTDAEMYAESMLEICRFCLESPLAFVSGITGAGLKKRIVQIMSRHFGRELSFSRRLLLVVAGSITVTVPVLLGVIHQSPGVVMASVRPFHFVREAQLLHASGPLPKYEVATIKPQEDDGSPHAGYGPDEFFVHDFTVKQVVGLAYGIHSNDQMEGVTGWMTSEHFDIEMKLGDEEAAAEQKISQKERNERFHLMLQALLADRFHLKTSETTKDEPVYELVVAKGGSKLKPSQMEDDSAKPGEKKPVHPPQQRTNSRAGTMSAQSTPLSALTSVLGGQPELGSGRIVIDKTGLTGLYDWSLTWTPSNVDLNAASPNPDAPGLFTAVEEQLGLRLVLARTQVQVLVVDHIDRPSPN